MKSESMVYAVLGLIVSAGLCGCAGSKAQAGSALPSLGAHTISGESQSIDLGGGATSWRLSAGETGAEVKFSPDAGQTWDFSRFASVQMRVRNVGPNPVTVRARLTNPDARNLAGVCQTASTVMPGQVEMIDLRIMPTPQDPGYEPFAKFYMYFDRIEVRDNTVDPKSIDALSVWLESPRAGDAIEISDLELAGTGTDGPRPFLPFIDKYGQYIHADWPGKIHSDADFAARRAEEEKERADWPGPADRNQFGGWASGPQMKATGFFYPIKHDGKWWLVDPEGKLFWSYGPTGVGFGADVTPITDRESWFASLPSRDGPMGKYFVDRKSAAFMYYRDREWVGFQFSSINVERKYGGDFAEELKRITTGRIRSWGFNTLANWSSQEMIAARQTPYVVAIHYGSPMIHDHTPDVFAPQWEESVARSLEKHRETTANDPWNIGYFVDNERRWGKFARFAGVALLTLECPPTAPAKIEFLKDLKTKYVTIDKLNQSWSTQHASWDALAESREKVTFEKPKNPNMETDCGDFGMKFAEKYFSTCRRLVKAVAPNNMYLGVRLNGHIDPSVIQLQTKYCDVISYNMYDAVPDNRLKAYDHIDFPMMVTEWGIDSDPRQSPFRSSKVQVGVGAKGNRRDLMVQYAQRAIVHPKLVGAHFFQYRDQPISGRPDGEGLLRGFVNVADTPNFELIQANRQLAYDLYRKRSEAR